MKRGILVLMVIAVSVLATVSVNAVSRLWNDQPMPGQPGPWMETDKCHYQQSTVNCPGKPIGSCTQEVMQLVCGDWYCDWMPMVECVRWEMPHWEFDPVTGWDWISRDEVDCLLEQTILEPMCTLV